MTESIVSAAEQRGRTEAEVRAMVRTIAIELSPARDETAGSDTRLADGLGYQSLSLVELAFTLEDEFDLPPIDEPTARGITTIGAVQDHVVSVLTARGEIASAG